MIEIEIKGEYIKLGQLLKLIGAVSSGNEAKIVILNGEVFVNHEAVLERGRKLHTGDIVNYADYSVHLK